MKKEELIKQLESIKAPEPNEEAFLQSEERLIKEVRNSFPEIIQERRVMRMKRKKFVLAVVSMAVVAVVLSVVIVPAIRIANAKQIAKNVIAEEMHVTVNGKDMSVKGNIVSVTVNGKEVTIDTKKSKIIKVSMPVPTSLTEEEKNKAIEIFKSSPKVKKFPILSSVAPPEDENASNGNGHGIINTGPVPDEEMKYINLSEAAIVSVKGYAFPDREGKYANVEVHSDLLPKGSVATFLVDLQRGHIVGGAMGPSGFVTPGIIKRP